jgi:putative membrane protein
MDWADSGRWMWWGMLPMMIFMVAAVVAVVWAIVAVTRVNPPTDHGSRRTPEDILAERFARGEIDAAEYRQRLGALRGRSPQSG